MTGRRLARQGSLSREFLQAPADHEVQRRGIAAPAVSSSRRIEMTVRASLNRRSFGPVP